MTADWKDYWQRELLDIGQEVERIVKEAESPDGTPASREAAKMRAIRLAAEGIEAFNKVIQAVIDDFEEDRSSGKRPPPGA